MIPLLNRIGCLCFYLALTPVNIRALSQDDQQNSASQNTNITRPFPSSSMPINTFPYPIKVLHSKHQMAEVISNILNKSLKKYNQLIKKREKSKN